GRRLVTGAPDTEWWAGEAPVGAARRRDPDGAGSTQGNTRGNGSHANGRGATVPGPAPADRRPAGGTPPPATGLKRSTVQVFIPPPEELPPFEEVVDPLPPRRPRPARGPGGDVAGRPPAGRAAPDVPPAPDLGGRPGGAAAPAPDLDRVPSAPDLGRRPAEGPPAPAHDLGPGTGVPPGRDLADDPGAPPAARGRAPSGEHRRRPIDRRRLAAAYDIGVAPSAPRAGRRPAEGPPAPEHDLGPGAGGPPGRDLDDDLGAPPAARGRAPSGEHRRRPIDRRRLAVVYDIDGPRVRLGIGWF